MKKNAALSFRVPLELKAQLEQIAEEEGRSLSQVCEALLKGGIAGRKKVGSGYIQEYLVTKKKGRSPD